MRNPKMNFILIYEVSRCKPRLKLNGISNHVLLNVPKQEIGILSWARPTILLYLFLVIFDSHDRCWIVPRPAEKSKLFYRMMTSKQLVINFIDNRHDKIRFDSRVVFSNHNSPNHHLLRLNASNGRSQGSISRSSKYDRFVRL